MGTYADRVVSGRSNMSEEQIRQAKNTRAHTRRLERQAKRRQAAVARNEAYSSLSVVDKLSSVDHKNGKGQGAKRQRVKLSQGA